ncbi:MAG TPA: hypothetical protein VET65_09990 [Candidatus Limnocylindrales bacterium]|nr:hypothetical protein [Candidatus Limnocylindrales bacterium]
MSRVGPIRGRIAAVSLRAAMSFGAAAGIAVGLVLGSLTGALLTWGAAAILAWQHQLSFTTGVNERLLPFGDTIPVLHAVQDLWFVVIPVTALAVAILGALFGALIGGLLGAVYNGSSLRAPVVIDVDEPL